MKRLAWVVGGIALVGCGAYVFVYLYRWEWNRALIMASFFLAAEVALATALVLQHLDRLERRLERSLDRRPSDVDPAVVDRLRAAEPERDHFAWLGLRGDRTSVFITMLVGGGVLISGLAWLLDRVSSGTAGRHLVDRLARDLGVIAFPDALVPDETEVLAERAVHDDDPDLRLLLGSGR